jgi:thioredoxin reductase (NADPH)
MQKIYNLIIIGSGPAGLTAAIYAARANMNPLLFEGPKPGGQLMGTSYVENWPGEKSILGPQLMMQMREQAKHQGTIFYSDAVVSTDFTKKPFTVVTDKNNTFAAHSIIIATGSSPNTLKCPGEQEYWGKGVTTCAVCDGALYANKTTIVIGGGDSAMESASFLRKFTDKITIIHITETLTASAAMQNRIIHDSAIKIIYNSTVSEIQGNGSHVTGITVSNQKTGEQFQLPADGVFINIGLKPNTAPFNEQINLDSYGYIAVNNHTKTSVSGVFVAGDVHDYRYRQAIVAAGSGCMAALDAYNYLKDLSII